MRRFFSSLVIAGFLVTGAAACSSDGSDGASDNTTTTAASGSDDTTATDDTSGGGGDTSGGNAEVQAYCDAVDDYVTKVKDAGAGGVADLADEAKELTDKAGELAGSGMDAEDAQVLSDCTKKATDALMPG